MKFLIAVLLILLFAGIGGVGYHYGPDGYSYYYGGGGGLLLIILLLILYRR